MFEKILAEFKAYDTIIIHRHNKPDGDALGSQIGLKHIIKTNFPEKEVYAVGDDPGFYGFMDDSVMDPVPDHYFENALSVILDCGAPALISDDRYQYAKRTVRIDHHLYTKTIADVEVIDSSYESCCGMVAHFAKESGLRLNVTAAKSLYTGMVTDSGRFRYDSTTSRTHELASFLLEQNFDPTEIYRHLYADSYESKKLKAQFILKVQFTPNNVAYIYTTREELQQINADFFTVSRGMVNTMADMKGTDIWCNFTESENGVVCELRSSIHNINPIAVKYGGGGHAKASGATVADRATAMAMLADLDKMTGEQK
jgi:phosphoesterase RecJ-like protein